MAFITKLKCEVDFQFYFPSSWIEVIYFHELVAKLSDNICSVSEASRMLPAFLWEQNTLVYPYMHVELLIQDYPTIR